MLTPKTMHPTSRTLLAYLDGEVPVDERREIAAHLKACHACRLELDGIEVDLDWHLVLEAASLPSQAPRRAEGFERLLLALREWKQSEAGLAAARARVEADAAGEALEVYLGEAAADAAARSERAQGLLAAFVGKRAATTLIKDIDLTPDVS